MTIAQTEGGVRGAGSEFMLAVFPDAGRNVVKQRVNAISLAPGEDFRRDSGR